MPIVLTEYQTRYGKEFHTQLRSLPSIAHAEPENRAFVEARFGPQAVAAYQRLMNFSLRPGVTFGSLQGVAADADPDTFTAGDVAAELYAVDQVQQERLKTLIRQKLKEQLDGVDVGTVAEVYEHLNPGKTKEDFAARWLTLTNPPTSGTP